MVCHTCHILPYPAILGMPSLYLPIFGFFGHRSMQVPWMLIATAPMAVCRPAAWLVAWRPPWSQWSITCWSGSTAHQDDVPNEFKMIEMVHYGPKSFKIIFQMILYDLFNLFIYLYLYIYTYIYLDVLMLYNIYTHDICDSWYVILWILWLPEDGIGSVCI